MSMTIKLHEATKQFQLSNKLAMYFLEKNDMPVKSHSSVINVDQLESLRELSQNAKKVSSLETEMKRPAKKAAEKKAPEKKEAAPKAGAARKTEAKAAAPAAPKAAATKPAPAQGTGPPARAARRGQENAGRDSRQSRRACGKARGAQGPRAPQGNPGPGARAAPQTGRTRSASRCSRTAQAGARRPPCGIRPGGGKGRFAGSGPAQAPTADR